MCQGRNKWSVSQNLLLILSLIQFSIICQFSLSCIPYSPYFLFLVPVFPTKGEVLGPRGGTQKRRVPIWRTAMNF